MPDQDTKSLSQQAVKKILPTPVLYAREAVARLRQENAEMAGQVDKILPRFAMRLAAEGQEVTAELLLDHARQGPDHLKAPRKISTTNWVHIHRKLLDQDKAFREMPELYPKLVQALADNDREKFWELTDRNNIGLYKMDNAVRYALSIKDHHNAKIIASFLESQTEDEFWRYGDLGKKNLDLLTCALSTAIEMQDISFIRWLAPKISPMSC